MQILQSKFGANYSTILKDKDADTMCGLGIFSDGDNRNILHLITSLLGMDGV